MLVVLMGVSGSGKSTLGPLVAGHLGLPFYDADDFHSPANRAKMAAGIPLTEEDREPWLRELAARIPAWQRAGGAILACSALRRKYRLLLADAAGGDAAFVFLDASPDVLRARLEARTGHYMPASLLDSQLETLEPPPSDEAIRVQVEGTPDEAVRSILEGLRSRRT